MQLMHIAEARVRLPLGSRTSAKPPRLTSPHLASASPNHSDKQTDELLGQTATDGPFFAGAQFTAADIAWAPFLERYAHQLPALHEGLVPRDASKYPSLAAWYEAMESQVSLFQ